METNVDLVLDAAELPDKLSDLLELAVNDAETVFASGDYKEDMGQWHYPEISNDATQDSVVCYVCMAGAVIANTCKLPKHVFLSNSGMGSNGHRFRAIDDMRNGNIHGAADRLGISKHFTDVQRQAVAEAFKTILYRYSARDGRAPWETYREVVAILKEVGL